MDFFQTERFDRNYNRYNGERSRVRQKVTELSSRFKSDPSGWLRNIERLRDSRYEIYRIKITEGDRLIFCIEEKRIILIDVGPHDVMEDFLSLKSSIKEGLLKNVNSMPIWFYKDSKDPNRFQKNSELSNAGNDDMRWLYEDELNESWLQFLDDEQFKVRTSIFEDVKRPGSFRFHLILGGAGTGKTVILLNVALTLQESGRNVVTRFSEQVLKYLNSGKQRVPGSKLELQPGAVVLFDDPTQLSDLRRIIQESKRIGVRALVVALDPFQWIERRVYEKFYELIDTLDPELHELSLCYRQSANVGSKALNFTDRILEKTSPFILDSKIEEHRKTLNPLKEICVEKVVFADQGGRFRIYSENLKFAWDQEIERVKSRIDLWTHWHPILIVEDVDGFPIPKEWKSHIKGLNAVTKTIHASQEIRGCEYQEVFLFLGSKTWGLITNGVLGATSSDWQKAISFHTLMTRPKDSLVIFINVRE